MAGPQVELFQTSPGPTSAVLRVLVQRERLHHFLQSVFRP